ncbi:hypothetical protein [Bradyrhizobium sp. ARR65]|uniref:hypothetical protein n=1 Tax=Bradyrhizobium sp. ARR65 TaxID=1040989 RepID=UPI000464024B|nr:hypothetical protein [Bradyrhizobium sp. ARR65]
MADEAFALSPIAARPVQPGEADYDAIREAFMETSRGRWFLGEYAKRNRNADTAMVLDAVARIEQSLAAQRQERASNDGLAEAVAALRNAVDQASEAASAAIAGLRLDEHLTPIHKGTRIIKEISWRWREIGADSRICDLIDSQLAAIETSCTRISAADARAAVTSAFDLIRRKLDEVGQSDHAPHDAAEAVAPAAASANELSAAAAELEVEPVAVEPRAETAFVEPEVPAEAPTNEAVIAEPDTSVEMVEAEAPTDIAVAEPEDPEISTEAADAHDEAVLEMVAIEMAASDPLDDFPPEPVAEAHEIYTTTTLPPVVEPVVAHAPEPTPPPSQVAQSSLQAMQLLPEPAPPVVPEPSLGSTIIANGILQRPKAAADSLAPIRRMSQAEKIAFFS